MANNKEKMLKAVERMESIVDQWYGQNLQQELAMLRSALENDDYVELSNAILESIDGCCTATSQIRDLGWALDEFEQAQHEIQAEMNAAVDAFEAETA